MHFLLFTNTINILINRFKDTKGQVSISNDSDCIASQAKLFSPCFFLVLCGGVSPLRMSVAK
jgi:hypothetical protein